jgi:CBS domain-containing protein
MRVLDCMMGTPYYCRPENNLGSATELMWTANCGFLPVMNAEGNVAGVITDRDICIALGTRGQSAGEVPIGEVMSRKVFSCAPEDDVHSALRTMREGHVRRLPVIAKNGTLVGVISMDDILLRAESTAAVTAGELSAQEVVDAFRAINTRPLPQVIVKHAVA